MSPHRVPTTVPIFSLHLFIDPLSNFGLRLDPAELFPVISINNGLAKYSWEWREVALLFTERFGSLPLLPAGLSVKTRWPSLGDIFFRDFLHP